MDCQVSLIASSVRSKLYDRFFKSLEGTSIQYEVIFAGNNLPEKSMRYCNWYYINTKDIKPAQCYEIARRQAVGETVIWVADDCEFPKDIIGKSYKFWKIHQDDKLIVSIQTRETGYRLPEGSLFDMDLHRFFGFCRDSPLMAPIGLMNRKFLDDMGGFDRRYVCGQYENDVVMRAYAEGGSVKIFGDKNNFIDIDHLGKSIEVGECNDESGFLKRPFAEGYPMDRSVLERSWAHGRRSVLSERRDRFEPYSEEDILTESQSNRGRWE